MATKILLSPDKVLEKARYLSTGDSFVSGGNLYMVRGTAFKRGHPVASEEAVCVTNLATGKVSLVEFDLKVEPVDIEIKVVRK